MHNDQPCVLVLEDDKFSSKLVYSALSQKFEHACIFPAYDIDQARILSQHLDVDLVICDVVLPDGNGVDFVFDLLMGNPLLEVILMSVGQPTDVLKRAKEMSTVQFITKPLKLEELTAMVRQRLAKSTFPTRKKSRFQARLSQLTPLDLVQMKCLSNASEVLEFIPRRGSQGLLYFRDGQIIHAETGRLLGEDAFHRILSWQGGEVNELPLPKEAKSSIRKNWQSLLMDAAHRLDTQKPVRDATVHLPNPAKRAKPLPEPTNDLQALLVTSSKGGLRASFGLEEGQAHAYAAHLAAMRPEVYRILHALQLGGLNKLEFANEKRGAMAQLDAHGSVLAMGSAKALQERHLTKNAITLMEQLLEAG